MTNNNHLSTETDSFNEPIAIVGANCQFPGMDKDIETLDSFYEMLLAGQTPIKDVPKNRWDIDAYYDADRQKAGKIVSRKGGFLDDPQLFDAAFFKISPIEAKEMDPQHRLFLEVSIRALNHANITLESLKHSNTGVYCGLSTHDYNQLNFKDKIPYNAYTYIGSAGSAVAGRLSYFLNLKGPCIAVDTACSSSLSALYLATTALRTRQCDMAIAGGVHLSLCPDVCIGLSKANMLSARGESRSFDAEADGYVRSEGCAVVVLKRLSDAIQDRNNIHAIVKSIMMNQDGRGMGMAAPNMESQIALHHSVIEQAHVTPNDIDYIETHGTGTILGDSVELQAIQHIHHGRHSKDNPLIIGALKSNLGHTISASGVAALIKVIGSLKQEMIPANLHYSTPNGSVDLNDMPGLLPMKPTPFPKRLHKKRMAQITNFGFTGTNVSTIIEEPPHFVRNETRINHNEALCFVISAHSEGSLHAMLKSHLYYLKTSPESLSDICYTLINCRDHYKYRCAIKAFDKASLIKKIESGDYEIKKTRIEEKTTFTEYDATQIYDYFLAGANIRSNPDKITFNPVDLPLYVFDRKAYWHGTDVNKAVNLPEDWCFELKYQYQPVNTNNVRKFDQRWLLMGQQERDFGLKAQGITIIQEEDNDSLDELDGIMVPVSFDSSLSEDIDTRIERQKDTLKKILALLKTLNHQPIELRLIFLTVNTLDSSTLKGFCKTLCLELPQYQTIFMELDTQDEASVSEQIMSEIRYNHGQSYEHVVAYREGNRLVSRFKKILLPKEKALRHPEGRYLITGGCGGLGLVTAQALLSAGARELVLISRTVDDPRIIEHIRTIQSDYPDRTVRPMSLDISDKKRLKEHLSEINKDGLLKGIIHAAGISVNQSLLKHQNQDIDQLFSAKVKGGWYLHELSKDYNLDFFVVYSSISSVFGSNQESVYSATNSFLDALISERRRLGLVGTAIQWGPWAETGMAKKRSRGQDLKNAFIHNDQGQAFIQRFINSDISHTAIISPSYLQFMLDFVSEPQPAFYKALAENLTQVTPEPSATLSTWLRDYSKIDATDQMTACKRLISNLCKELSGLQTNEDLDENEGFFEIGLDSLNIAELATRLKKILNPLLHVTATIAFDYPSINQLSRHIYSELNQHCLKTQPLNGSAEPDDIAIIGMSCSLPNAPDIAAFEHLLENGLSGIQDIPEERWDHKLYYDANPDTPGKTDVNKLGLIDNIKLFDPGFFGISPREAPFIEPQQRLFLENCYHALESANHTVQSLRGSSTGVFAGVGSSHEYYTLLEQAGLTHEAPGMFSITGKALNIIPGRVAYAFDFKGPALSIDTACSSSLVAVHDACNYLNNREIDFALAGGVNILLRPEGVINLSKAKALSPAGQCKTFDEHADGYVRSEGCGVLFLKRMADALRDKDTILAVIKGSAINHDGQSAGLTVPNGKSQADVMKKALSNARLSSDDISYIEAHGTGTSLGDPIEVHAINTVYGARRADDNPLYVGTVKTNIGHLESASGIAGLIKVVIGLQKKKLYKNLNFNRLNPNIKLDATQIVLHNKDWDNHTPLKTAGVSAFGFSGTNAHVILQEHREYTEPKQTRPFKTNALVLSAKSQRALDDLVTLYQDFLATTLDDFNDVCFTAATCRDHYPYRLALLAKDAYTASQLLKSGHFAVSPGQKNNLALHQDTALNQLLTAYLEGQSVDWGGYYKTHSPALTKVALPNYPFARKEFWLPEKNSNTVNALNQSTRVSCETALEHLYEIQWSALNLNRLSTTDLPEFWVISTDKVRADTLFGSLSYQLIESIDELEPIEDKNIIFLYENDQLYELFHCCQKLFKSLPASFILMTENAYLIHDSESPKVNPYHTMACAFWKSFKNELELDRNYAIDLDSGNSLNTSLAYMFNRPGGESQFAVRDTIYVPRLKQKKHITHSIQPQETLFDPQASYLITGGTGGLAKPLMAYLIRHGVRHMVITSRSECPPETQNLIEQARQKGISIIHHAADASSLSDMKNIIEPIQQSIHPLKGVFHLAGVIQNDLIIHLSQASVQQVIRAKMESALVLHELTKHIALDLFVMFSSASSILGSRRQANYAAANGFLDGLAHLRQQQGLPGLAINWGIFDTTGMASNKIFSLKKRGFIPLDEQSIDILDLLLRSDLPQMILCPIQWELYFKSTPRQLEFEQQLETTPASGKPLVSFLQQRSQQEQHDILSQILSDIATDVLGLDAVERPGNRNDLFAMGMDSLMSLELRSRMHDKLQCPGLVLPIEYFVTDPSIDKITGKIIKELNKLFLPLQDKTPVQDLRVGAIALSDAQYGYWLTDKMGGSFNCPKQVQLHGKLNRDYLYKSFAFTINQNSTFWLNFHKDIPIQMLKRQGKFTWIYEDISSDYDQDVLNKVLYHNTMRYIPLTEQPLIRVYLYKLKEELHELHIIIPHIILDECSYRILFEQIKNNYQTLLLGKRLIPVQEPYGYLDYIKHHNSHYNQNLRDKIDFWRLYNQGFQPISFGRIHHVSDAAKQSQHLFNYRMNKPFIETFKAWHQDKNINVSTSLIAACHIVFYKISSQKKIPIVVLHNDREVSRFNALVGLLIEFKRLNITLNEHDSFMEFFRSIENEFIKAAPFQKCSIYIKNAGLKESLFSIGDHLINLYYKLFLSKKFKATHLDSKTISYYLKGLSKIKWFCTRVDIKDRLNQLLHTHFRLLKPKRLSVIFNLTAGFFIKEPRDNTFADLDMSSPNHYGNIGRPLGNQTLLICFTKDQDDEYRLSINGPLTRDCKHLIAQELNHVMSKIMENETYRIADLIQA